MRRSLVIVGLLLALVPSAAEAQAQPLFERIFEESRQALPKIYPKGQMTDYIIKEMERWDDNGIKITENDIASAIEGDQIALCNGKVDMDDKPLEFARGSDASAEGSCIGLMRSIQSLVRAEQESDQLGKDLLAIANGSELSIADEGSRPVNMGRLALLLRRVWSGTGAGILPWDPAADTELSDVGAALAAADDLDRVVMRFRHGYFRAQREQDQTFNGIGNDVGDKLQALAGRLGISGDQTLVGEFTVPGLSAMPDIAVWARKDDIGLMWVYPTRFAYPKVKPGGDYPVLVPNGKNLAYPFTYIGSSPAADMFSPLCNRTVARNGYLCRPLPPDAPDCAEPSDDSKISLVLCDKKVKESTTGPFICDGLKNLYMNDGTPLTDPANPGRLNPALKDADVRKICEPGTKVLYQDEITAHACYIGHCLLQSMSGHTLIPNRNTNLVNEMTSPYLACMRPDPQLGLYAEVAQESPYPLPRYIGHELVQSFEQDFCAQAGKAAHPVLGFCSYREDARTRTPDVNQVFQYNELLEEAQSVTLRQVSYLSLATIIGQRAAGEQAHQVERKVFASLATLVQQTADLILELKRAPLTQSACPWTGPVISSSVAP